MKPFTPKNHQDAKIYLPRPSRQQNASENTNWDRRREINYGRLFPVEKFAKAVLIIYRQLQKKSYLKTYWELQEGRQPYDK